MADVKRFTAAGQKIEAENTGASIHLVVIVWTGPTTAGDTCILKQINGDRIWEGRAVSPQTYLGVRFPDEGISIRRGVEVESISNGSVYLYFREV